MNQDILFPSYVPRQEEQDIRDEVALVQDDGRSRAVLLYGPGGIGKTWLVRALAESEESDDRTSWLAPVDVDDPEYWLVSNLEQQVAEQLDPRHEYFEPYLEYLSKLPSYTRPRIGHETVVSHLGRIKRVFVDCYRRFIESSGKTVVMSFDTVETIRGVYLLYTLTQWMKALPGTLFILSGRPLPGAGDTLDPIKSELEDPYQHMPVRTVDLGEFTQPAATDYLSGSRIARGLTAEETEALVLLSRGHPLWLAFTISYVSDRGIPEEAATELATIRRIVPYEGELQQEGRSLQEAFKRRLVTPYRGVDFWHEAVKRLAVVRQSMNQPIWQELMSDRQLPDDAGSSDQAWEALQRTPWIRTRANGRYVTLHDAVAEELALRIIPLHDQDQHWRRDLWRRAAAIYSARTQAPEEALAVDLAVVNERLQRLTPPTADERPPTQEETAEETASIEEVARLDARKGELDQFRAIGLYYQILSDFASGSQQFLSLFEEAQKQNDVFLQDRLALEMQRFLPGAVNPYTLDDIVGAAISEFQQWLRSDGRNSYLEIGMSVAGYLIENEQAEVAIRLLDGLPESVANHGQLSRLRILKSNAYMRFPGHVADGLPYLEQALRDATALESDEGRKLLADAYKELGFYYRNSGLWQKADDAYRMARDALSASMARGGSDADHENMASLQTNWAYLKGLNGDYRDGSSLVESAIIVRHKLKLYQQEGISWSVCGEVYRYERRFTKAWEAYAVAEQTFQGQRNWSWLGAIYQQQAICLAQATEDGINLVADRDPIEQCKRLITLALDICRDQNLRNYPSALNRAGRIYGLQDFRVGLRYLKAGIDWARRLSDGWFWFANLIEYAELSYRAWVETRDPRHRDEIDACEEAVRTATQEYGFNDLQGRWKLLRGHLGIHDALEHGDKGGLGAALDNYKTGFVLLAQGYMGSSGASAVAREFDKFARLFSGLSPDVRAQWLEELRSAWFGVGQSSTPLLARLEQLY
jgi:hypothetical protein